MPAQTVRIPLCGPYNTRVSAFNSLSASSSIVGIGIVGVMIVGATTAPSSKDQRMINCFSESVSDTITGKKTIYTVKRPGVETHTTPQAGSVGSAILVWSGQGTGLKVISAFGGANSTLYDGTTGIGTITGVARAITETFVSTTPTLLVPSGDSTAWYYDTGVGTMTKVTDGDFPGNAGYTTTGSFAHIDGFACIMTTDGYVWASDINSVTSWAANSKGAANSYPDPGVGLVRYKNYIMAFKTQSVQFFINAGLTPFPLTSNPSMTLKVGAVSADAIATISDTVFWAGSTAQGGISVFQFDGGVSRISTPEIDSSLVIAGASNISMTTIRFYGRSFVVIKASSSTYVYCVEEKAWHEWTTSNKWWYKCTANSTGSSMVTYAVSNTLTAGKVYRMDNSSLVFTDDGSSFSGTIQMALWDGGTMKRKFCSAAELVCDRQTTTSPVTLSWTDDDYQSTVTWGTVDTSASRQQANRCGAFRRRGWIWTHSANTPFRAEAMDLSIEVGNT